MIIAFEGIDGSGKRTQAELLLRYLRGKGIETELLSFPDYDNPVGKLISRYLKKEHELDVRVLFLLHTADRVAGMSKIEKSLGDGKTIILDRWFNSALAYQCAEGFPLKDALKIAEVLKIRKPDVVLYLRISPETSIKRKSRQKTLDRNEENLSLLRRVSQFYERLARENIFGKWFVLDGEKSVEEVFEQVKRVVNMVVP